MATIERALNAHSLFWVKDEAGDRIGIVWGLDGVWRWSVGSARRATRPMVGGLVAPQERASCNRGVAASTSPGPRTAASPAAA